MELGHRFCGRPGLWVGVAAGVFFSAILIWHARYYMPFLSDDALISLRYLKRLLQGEGLTWTAGHPVEGYSNLLWILLLAIPSSFGVDPIMAARILGTACAVVVIVSVLAWYSGSRALKAGWLALTAGLLFYCLAGPAAVWAIGGLEQPLCAAFVAIIIPLGFAIAESNKLEWKKTFAGAVALGLLALTRPDGPIFAVGLVFALIATWGIAQSKLRYRLLVVLISVPLLCYAGQTGFRLFYYGEPVANTALVKLTPSLHHLSEGLKYVSGGLVNLAPFSIIAIAYLIASLWSRAAQKRSILLLTFALSWISYLIVIGGDIFPAYRLFVPIIPVFTFALVESLGSIHAFCNTKRMPVWILASVLVALFAVYGMLQVRDPENRRAKTELWEWDGQVLGLFLKKAFWAQQPLVAVTAAGCIPYWSELPSLDMLGLNDYYLPRHPPADLGQGYLGHEFGDGKYVMEQRPDVIVFHAGVKKPVFRSGVEMQKSGELSRLYVPVNVLGTFPYSYPATIWIRKESEKIGVRRMPEGLEIPGYLLSTGRNSVAQFNPADKLVVLVSSNAPAGIDLALPADGKWACEVVSKNASAADCQVTPAGANLRTRVTTGSSNPIEVEKVILRKVP